MRNCCWKITGPVYGSVLGWLPEREAPWLRWDAMQLLMNVSRLAGGSFFASATALQPRMRCCTFLDPEVAGTTCRGGVAVTGCEGLFGVSARVAGALNAPAAVKRSK